MKISISTGCFYFLPFERGLNIIKKAGFENIEIVGYWKDKDWEVGQNIKGLSFDKIKRYVKAYGLEISAFHDPSGAVYNIDDSVIASETQAFIYRKKLPWLIAHLPHSPRSREDWWNKYKPKAIKQYEDLIQHNNLCLENMAPIENYEISITDPRELYEFCSRIGAFINLDMIHVLESGQNLRNVILDLNDKIKNIHVSGYSEKGRVHFDQSDVDILDYLKYLNLNNLDTITIETKFDPELDDDNSYIRQCKRLKSQLEECIKKYTFSKIPFSKPTFLGKETKYIEDSVARGTISGNGFYSLKCKEWFEKNYDSKYTVITTSCTHALELAANVCDISINDEVIMPSFTFTATANAFINVGAKIKFIDIKPGDMNIDECLIENAITERTKAIVVVHYSGVACDMDKIMQIAEKYNLYVIEDAAQAILCEYKGKKLGTIGDIGCFSFHATKNITMGEGGAFILNNEKLKNKTICMSDNGIDRRDFLLGKEERYCWKDRGASYMSSDLNAAYLYAQLEDAKSIIQKRVQDWNLYNTLLMPLQNKHLLELPVLPPNIKHNGHIFFIKCKDFQITRQLQAYLKAHNIISTYHYTPLHITVPGKKYGTMVGEDKFTSSESKKLLRLPLFFEIKKRDIRRVVNEIYNYFGEKPNVT